MEEMDPNEEGIGVERFKRVNFSADIVWGQIEITKSGPWGAGEELVLDNPWLQRLRRVHQLQSAWWVFPTAEHTRFTHLLGSMHLAGRFAKVLYPSLKKEIPSTPSLPLVEETLRLAGLLHDVGHGPFSHFFDKNYGMPEYGVDHEVIGRKLILGELAESIKKVRLSPSGLLRREEKVDPYAVAWLMDSRDLEDYRPPKWVSVLKPVLCGPATVDNMDYVPRDAMMCGVKMTVLDDIERIINYSFISGGEMVLHGHALASLQSFLAARLTLYLKIYFHRTARRVDLGMAEIFAPTIHKLIAGNPLDNMQTYLNLTNWSVMEAAVRWLDEPVGSEERTLGESWRRLGLREFDWTLAHEMHLPSERKLREPSVLEEEIRKELPEKYQNVGIRIDLATAVLIPENPLTDDGLVAIYEPLDGKIEHSAARELLPRLPKYNRIMRVFTKEKGAIKELREAISRVMSDEVSSVN